MWVDSLSHEAWVGMDLATPPRDRPKPPQSWEPDRLWRVSPGHAWETITVP